jgi:hypothetical protein
MKAKPSKAYIKDKVEGNYLDLLKSVNEGAEVKERNFWNKTEYWIYYPKGGCHRISLPNYKKLTKLNN